MEPRPKAGSITAAVGSAIGLAGWGASWTGYVNPTLGWALLGIGSLWGLVSLVWGFWPLRVMRRWRRPPIRLTPSLQGHRRESEELTSEQLLRIGFLHPAYLEVSVKNLGTRVLSRVVGRVKLIGSDKRELESYVAWSNEPGEEFLPGGPLEAEIAAGSERVARLAIAYLAGEQGWFRIDRKDPTPTGHFGADMDVGKDIAQEGAGLACTAEFTLNADGYAPYAARLPLRLREMPNGIYDAEFGALEPLSP